MSARSTSTSQEPETVHPFVQWVSQLWLFPKRAVQRRRLRRPVIERVGGKSFLVTPDVFNPVIFRTGRYLAEFLQTAPALGPADALPQRTALDVGTGCGIHAIFAAARGFKVEAVDISAAAIRCSRINVILNECEEQVTVREGDLFLPVANQRFDLVLCSLPKFRGTPESAFELGWRSPDVIDRFAAGLPKVLKPDGMALVLLTSHGDERGMLDGLEAAGLTVQIAQRKHFGVEIMTIYRVTHLLAGDLNQGNGTVRDASV